MQQQLANINQSAAALGKLQPMSEDNAKRLQKKFRLEWNYNSNHIEGNTLTYGETELFLIFGETKGNHEYREYEEMQGHDVALKMVEELAEDKERTLNEQFIRQLNQVILKKPFYKEAITPDGQATKRLIKVGEYKSMPNSVLLQNGEMFHYASPAETPAKMNDLLQWYREAAENNQVHPVEVAAELHYRFVLIHPFDDGNGRISRLLMNYHLLKNGHPPVIIKSADKKNYLRALHEADTGNIPGFIEYIAEQLLWSYDISIKAAKGENIDEAGDWEKEIELLTKKVEQREGFRVKYSISNALEVVKQSAEPIINIFNERLSKINAMFIKYTIEYKRGKNLFNVERGYWTSSDKLDQINTVYFENNKKIEFRYRAIDFKQNGVNPFSLAVDFSISFDTYQYQIEIMPRYITDPATLKILEESVLYKTVKYYHQYISETELGQITNVVTKHLVQEIEKRLL